MAKSAGDMELRKRGFRSPRIFWSRPEAHERLAQRRDGQRVVGSNGIINGWFAINGRAAQRADWLDRELEERATHHRIPNRMIHDYLFEYLDSLRRSPKGLLRTAGREKVLEDTAWCGSVCFVAGTLQRSRRS